MSQPKDTAVVTFTDGSTETFHLVHEFDMCSKTVTLYDYKDDAIVILNEDSFAKVVFVAAGK